MPTLPARADNEHATHVAKLLEKLGDAPLVFKDNAPAPAPAEKPEPVEEQSAEPATDDAVAPAEEAEPTELAVDGSAKPEPRASTRLQRSLDLERRAEESKKRARAEAARVKEQRADADARARAADRKAKAIESREAKLEEAQAALEAEIQRLRTDPMEFAAAHGMTGKDVAEYVRQGANPTTVRLNQMAENFKQEIARVEREGEKKLKTLTQRISEERAGAAHERFVEYVASDMDRFEAINTIYSQSELLAKANELAERNQRLQLGYDGDKLCEQLEVTARKDPRWSRISSRYERKRTSESKPNAPAKPEPNARPRDKGDTETERASRPRPRAQAPESHDRVTPEGRHRDRVERIIRTTRFSGF